MAGNRDLSKFANQLFVDSNGNIGLATNVNIAIGHTNPSYKFDLLGPANINGSLNVNGQATFNSDVVFSGQISNVNVSDIITNNVSVSGSLTALSIASTTFTSENVDIDYLNVSGVSTFSSDVSIQNLNVLETLNSTSIASTDLLVSGVSTFSNSVYINDLTSLSIASTSFSAEEVDITNIRSTNIDISGILTSTNAQISNLNSTSINSNDLNITGILTASNISNLNASGISTFSDVNVTGILTANNTDFNNLNSDSATLSSASIDNLDSINSNITGILTAANIDVVSIDSEFSTVGFLTVNNTATFDGDVNYNGTVVYTGVTSLSGTSTIDNLSVLTANVSGILTASDINVLNSITSAIIDSTTGEFENLNTVNLEVSGISTFSNDVVFDQNLSVSGVSTFVGDINAPNINLTDTLTSDIINVNQLTSGEVNTSSLDVSRSSVSYTGTLIGVSTNIISNTDTTGVLINYLATGTNIPQGTLVSSIGSSSITLSQNSTNSITQISKTGIFESANGNVILGITTSNLEVGFGVTGNTYISVGTTITEIGISSITLSQNATNTYFKQIKSGNLAGISTDIISGIDTSGIVLGQNVTGDFISIGSTVFGIGSGEITLSQAATNTEAYSGSFEIYFIDNFTLLPLDVVTTSIYTYADPNSGVANIYSTTGQIVGFTTGSVGVLTGTSLSYNTATLNQYQASIGTVTSLDTTDLSSNIGIISDISGTNLNYTGIGTISTLNVTTLNADTVDIESVDIATLTGQNFNFTGFGTVSSLTSVSGSIGILSSTSITATNVSVSDSITSLNISADVLSSQEFVADNSILGVATITTAVISDLLVTDAFEVSIGNSSVLFGQGTIVAAGGTINDLSGNSITYLSGDISNLDSQFVDITNLLTSPEGNIGILTGTNLEYTGVGTIGTIDSIDGTIDYLSGINLNYSGISTLANIESNEITVNTSLTSPLLEVTTGSISNLSGTNLYYQTGIITSLTGTDISYSGLGTITNLEGTNINYSGIGTIASLEGTTISYSGSGSFGDIDITDGIVAGGNLTAAGATFTNDVSSFSISAENGSVINLSGDTLSYNSGIVTTLTGTDLSYSGLGTVSNLQGTNISYTGVGTFGQVGITTATIGTVNATNVSILGNLSVADLTVGVVTANSVITNDITSIEGTITSLSGQNLNYSGVGTITSIDSTNVTSVNLDTQDINVSGIGTIPTIESTNINNSQNVRTDYIYSRVGIITELSGDIVDYNSGSVDYLSGVNLNYTGIGTINQIDVSEGSIDTLSGVDLNYSGIGTIQTLVSTQIENSANVVTDGVYSRVGVITELSGDTIDYNSGSVDYLSGVNLDYAGIGTITNIDSTTITTTDISGDNASFTGISTFNKVGVTSLTSQSIFGFAGIITSLTGETLNYTESATISNVVIGGDTELVVTGDTRITGILTVGNSSVTISGINDSISGVSTITANVGNISTITGIDADYTNIDLESLTFTGINTSNNFNTEINIVASNSGLSTSYNLILPAQLGIPGTVLTLESDGNLGFTTAGLYENRIYVSPVNGDDANDGKARPVKSIKRAAQLASFESFVIPGGRYLDAANLLTANKDFIAAEVVGFVTNTYPGIITSPDYDEATCKRDVGYIVDAISYDLSYGGNSKSVEAGLAYWNAGTSYVDGESVETIAGFNHIITISKYIINNVAIQTSYQSPQTEFQTFDLTLAYDDQCNDSAYSENCCANVWSAIGSYVGIVTSIIGIGTTAAPEVTLPTSKSTPVAVIVEAGEYVEDNPIILYEDVSIIGDNLRNTIIRPSNAGKDLFRVRNGCYLTGFALKDAVDPAGVPQYTFNNAVAFDDPADPTTSREGYAIKNTKPIITRSPYIQNCSILSFLGANGILVDGSKVDTLNTAIIPEEAENPVEGPQPEFGKSMVAAAFTMVSFGGIGWRVINDGYSQVVSCFQIFCRYGSLAQSGGYLSITNSATNFGLYSLRSTGFNQRSYIFDRGIIAATGTSGGLQTLKVIGLGRADQELYVLRFINNSTGIDETSNFKLAPTIKEVDISVGVNIVTNTIGIQTHGFANGDSVIYLGNESTIPPQVIGGLVNLNEYYVEYVNDDEFKLYEDDSLTRLVDLTSTATGINTFVKGNQEFFNSEMLNSHTSYQRISLASTTSTLNFVPGREITQVVNGGTAVGIAYTYDSTTRDLIVSVEAPGGIRNNFGVTGVGVNDLIQDHSGTPVSIAVTAAVGISTLHTVEFKVDSTQVGSQILGVGGLPENYKVHFHRPSIINSSSHTWEFSGSGTDYNALPQNGGKTRPETEQVFSQGGRVYSSGTNELGDFKIGNFITAFNRTGNIIFNNKVSIGQLDSLRLSLSGGVAIEEFSTDIGLGDNEVGGPLDSRVSTQKAVRTFLNNRLGNFIDKDLSTNAVPSAVVQLNAFGQINADLIPPKVVNYYSADVGGGRTTLVDRIPAVDLRQGDTVVEPDFSYVLISDVYSQYLILSDTNRDYNFNNGDEVVSAVSNGGAIGIVTAPTSVGYGTTGLVKGVLLNGTLTSGGSGYTNAGIYTGVTLTSTSGVGADAKAIVTISSGSVTDVDIIYGGRYYDEGDTLTVINPADIGGRSGGSDFVFTVSDIETRLYIELTNNQKFTGSTLLNDYIEDGDATGISTSLTDTYAFTFDPTSIETGGDIDFTNDRIVIGPNNFADGDNIVYSAEGGNTLEELISGDTYYIKRVGISSVELYTTYALSTKKNFLSNGTGTHSITRKVVNTSENKLTFVNHGYTVGDAVRVSGNVPGGITSGDYYFVGSVTTNSFSLHDTQQTALTSVNGLIFNAVDLTSVGSGTFTLTKQNVRYTSTINTSSNILDNWTVLSSGTVDAANITTGTISPSRLGSGTANSDTFLGGDSVYRKAVKSVGIGTTTPMTITSSSFEVDNGVTKHFGDLEISLNRVEETLETYSTTGVAKFKTSTFDVGDDGAVSIKNSQFGDVDAATLGGFTGAYYLDLNNATGTVSIPRGGTGLSALPSEGYLLVGNGSAYTLTGDPTIAGTLTGEITIKSGGDIELPTGTWTGDKASKIQNSSNNLYLQYTTNLIGRNSAGTNRLTLNSGGDLTVGGTVTGTRLISNVANGTAPLTVTSSTVVTNLNADLVDGIQGASLLRSDANDTFSGTLTYSGTGTALNFTSTSEVILADHSSNSSPVPFDIRKSGSTLTDSESYGILHLSRLNHNNSATSAGASLYFQLRDSGGTLREYAGISGQKTEAGAAGGRLQFYRYGRTSLGYWDSTGLYVGTDKVWTAGNDGSGSGLDADKLDNLDSSQFLRSDADDSFNGTITGNKIYVGGSVLTSGSDAKFQVNGFMRTGSIFLHSGGLTPNNTVNTYRLNTRNDGTLEWGTNNTPGNNNKIWHEGNDGSGSGLDADKLDNLQASQFLRSDATDTITGGSILQFETSSNLVRGYIQATETNDEHLIIATSGGEDIAFKDGGVGGTTNFIIRGDGTLLQGTSNTIWHAGNDGPSSGLNADLLDDLHASQFLRSDTNTSTTGYLGAEGFVGTGGGSLRLSLPHGASYATSSSSVTGAIKVTLPQSWTNTMMRMTIKVYEYATGESFEVVCGGYNYGGNSSWINTFGYIVNDPQVGRNFNIRFGHDGSKCCIYIGETNSTWSYPQVTVTEFEAGYSSYGEDTWNDGWSIGFATSLGTITSTLSNRQVGKYVDGNLVWTAGTDGSGSGLDADTVDGIQGASLLRSDANDSASGVIDFLGGSSTTPAIRIRSGGNNWSEGLAIHPSADNGFALAFFRTSATLTTNTNTWAIGNLGTNSTNNFGLIRNGLTGSAGIRADAIFDVTQAGTLRFGFTPTVGSNTMWHAGNDGSGSGLDADLLDGQQGSYYRQAWQNIDAGTRTNYTLKFQPPTSNYAGFQFLGTNGSNAGYLLIRGTSDSDVYTAEGITLVADQGWLTLAQRSTASRGVRIMSGTTSSERLKVTTAGDIQFVNGASFTYNGNTIWHAGNDGSASGLDADTVDGYHFLQTQGISAVGNFGQWQVHSTYTDFNSSINYWGWNYVQGNTNAPNNSSSQWYRNRVSLGSDYGLNYSSGHYWLEMAYPRSSQNAAGHMWLRVCENGSVGSWTQVGSYIGGNVTWHAGNDGAGSTLDADNLDGYTWDSSGKNVRATEFYADNWFRNYNSGEGLYNQATGAHWYSSADGYWELTGNTQDQDTNLRFRGTYNGNVEGWIHANGSGWFGFLNNAGQWALRHYNVDGYSPNLYFDESANETWTGNPGNDQGKIEYHSNRFYMASGANSTEIVRFRQSGTDRVVIQNSGNIQVNGSNVWHAGNDGSGSGLDADTLDGLQLHTGRNNEANKVVRTDGNGYIQAGWINTTSGTNNRTLPDRFYGSKDAYLRYYTLNYSKAHLGGTYKYGNSRPNITSNSSYWVGTMGWGTTDMNSVFDWGSGFIDSWSNPGNQPSGTSHWVGVQALHYTNNSNRYGWQMVGGPIGNLRFRNTWPSFSSWRTVPVLDVNSNNGGTMYAGSYADANDTAHYINPSDGGFVVTSGTSNRVTLSTNDSGFRVDNAEGNGVTDVRLGAAWGNPGTYVPGYNYWMSSTGLRFLISNSTKGEITNSDLTMYGSLRSPIFYDSNNTGYYTNPASISSMYGVAIRGDSSSSDSANQIFFWGTGDSTTSAIGFKANAGEFTNPTGNGDGYNTYFTMDTDGRGWVFRRGTGSSNFTSANNSGWILNNGIWQSNGSMRAPIFYDSNNTGYYIDPTSTSDNCIRVRGGALFGPNVSWSKYLLVGGDGRKNRTNDANVASVCTTNGNLHIDAASGYETYINYYDGNNVYFGNGGNGTVAQIASDGTFRSPVFYDYNDTGYYCNPRSASRLSGLRLDGVDNQASGDDAILWINKPNNNDWAMIVTGNLEYGIDLRMASSHTYAIRYQANGSEYSRMGTDLFYHNSNIRAPIFYDTNNTGYYLNPASTSRVNAIEWDGSHAKDRGDYLTFYGDNSANHSISSRNSGSGADDDIRINSYGSVFINLDSNNNNSSGADFRIGRHGGTGTIAQLGLFDVYGDSLYCYSAYSFRSPIFYDSDNTGYYVDPTSSSVLEFIEGSNDCSFRGANRAINDWDYSGLTTNPTVNSYDDGSWYIDCGASNNWSRGLLSKRRFRRVENLTLEYEAYLQSNDGGAVHYMIGFAGGDTGNYSYNQTPANLTYHDNTGLSVYTNGSGNGSDYNFDTRNNWWRFRTVLKGSGARHYVYRNGTWNLIKDVSTNDQNSYEWVRVLVSGYRQRIYLRDVKVYVADQHYRGSNYIDNVAGNLTVSGDITAYRLVDSTNSSYYCDPHGTSNLLVLSSGRIYSGYDSGQSNAISCSNWFRSNNSTGWYNATYAGGIYMTDSTWVRVYNNKQFYSQNYIQSDSSVRAPIFYDSNNTGYNVDPASTSRFNQIRPNVIHSPYNGSDSNLARSSYPYGFGFQEDGAWSNPYPDLVLQYHTGVTFAANSGYDGMTFKADYNNDTVIFRVNGGSNYLYKYYWMYTNTTGIYSDSNGAHFYPNTSFTYGTWRVNGSRNNYTGIVFDDGGDAVTGMFDSSGNGGDYNTASGWHFYYHRANDCLAISGSTTSSTYECYVNGDLYASGNINSASDARLKDNVNTIENALDKVLNLRGVTFTWNNLEEGDDDYGKTQMGFIAQEVEPFVPEVVTYAEDIDQYGMNYGQMTAILTEAIKQQQEIINNMKKEIEDLKKRLGD